MPYSVKNKSDKGCDFMENIYLLPKPVFCRKNEGSFNFLSPEFIYGGKDSRISGAVSRLYEDFAAENKAGKLTVEHGDGQSEEYSLVIEKNGIKITAGSAAGAFYGIQTLKQLLIQGSELPCLEIHDCPRLSYRGFYHDVTRGRIPKLETLKKLADELALYKINSLQLYVEHSFDFKEYKEINAGQEPLTPDEITELDRYCRERFIDLVPSLSCFGHLYALLQSDKYKHLCELEDYIPQQHLWAERMAHHTIDVSNPESLELIKSLIDQYLPLFSSKYFNICCDETFDLGKGRNKGGDEGKLYTGFVSKLIEHVESKGKTVMLWGDIVLKHAELLPEISEKAVLLNWDYRKNPPLGQIKCFERAGRRQIVCPGIGGWSRLSECVTVSESNIRKMAVFAVLCGADGLLNTNWGDYGHLCDPQNAMFGMILGAAEAWNPGAADKEYFDSAVSVLHYRNKDGSVVKALRMLSENDIFRNSFAFYREYTACGSTAPDGQICNDVKQQKETCQKALDLLDKALENSTADAESVKALRLAANGCCLLAEGMLKPEKEEAQRWKAEFSDWIEEFCVRWEKQNKKDELPVAKEFFNTFMHAAIQRSVN